MAAADRTRSPATEAEAIERVVLEEVIQLHPERLTIPELILRIATDPYDHAKQEKISRAIRELRRTGLLRYRENDDPVEPTHAGIRAFELLTA
jgi:hypothetical protein